MNPFCNTCGIEMEQGPVHVSENNPEPYPQGTMRRYKCAQLSFTCPRRDNRVT